MGLTIPSLLGAGSAGLAPGRFGTGSGILNIGTADGTVLGVAGLVAILAKVSPADPLPAFREQPGAGHRVLRGRGGGVARCC